MKKIAVLFLISLCVAACSTTAQSKNGSFAHCFNPPVHSQDYEINTQGKNQAGGAIIGVLLIGVPVMVPDIETYLNKDIDFIVDKTTKNACIAQGFATAYGKKIKGREIQVNSTMFDIYESKCLVRVEVIDDQQSLTPGDKRIFSSYQLWSIADGEIKLSKENISDDEVRLFMVASGKIKP